MIELSGPALAVDACRRRLAPLAIADGAPHVCAELSWWGPATGLPPGSEAAVQAVSGLMRVHGRDAGSPRRLGLEVASVTAGILASHAILAALVGAARGIATAAVRTSALEAALLHVSHRMAAATTGSEWVPVPPGPAPGPPFRSTDGHWLELETLDASAWRAFWERLGAADADLQTAWRLFRPRYFRGTCTLPPGLHEATRAHTLADLQAAAEACAVSLTAVRSYEEVLADPGFDAGHPSVEELRSGPGAPDPAPDLPTGPPAGAAPGPKTGAAPALPLHGLRVVEATSRLQGPLAGRLLQTLGAHVVRVEPPGGDISRTVPPAAGEDGTFFLSFNRGKEFVELDLARPEPRAELAELIAGADVFLHNWRPDRASQWGLEARDLVRSNPGLVFVHGSGWGETDQPMVGTDFLVQAYSGVACGLTPEGRPPFPSRALLTDYMGALNTCEAALFGLYRRALTGRGQRVGGSLFGGAMALQAHVLEALRAGREQGRRHGRPLWTEIDHPLPTADGHVALEIGAEDAERLCRALDLPLTATPAAIAERIAAGVSAEWEERLVAAGLSCAAVRTDLATLPADPRLAGMFEHIGGTAWAPSAPWRLD